MSSLYRTARNKFVLYETDGLGRDGYISYNNGGFWKPGQQSVPITNRYDHPVNRMYHSLEHQAAPFRYYSDGSGRDSYVLQNSGGLKKDFLPLSGFKLADFLRTDTAPLYRKPLRKSVEEKRINCKLMKMEKGLINRLYTSYMKKKNLFLDSSTNRMKTSYNSPNGFQRDRMLTRSDCHFPRFENEKNTKERLFTESDKCKFRERATKVQRYELSCKNENNVNSHKYCVTESNFNSCNNVFRKKAPKKLKMRKIIIKHEI